MVLLLVGCGVSQDQYDAALTDLEKVQQELQSVTAAYEELVAEQENLQVDNPDKLSADYEDLHQELTSLRVEKDSLEANCDELKTENEAIAKELSEIKESYESVQQEFTNLEKVYPPKYFSTREELKSWVQSNAVPETPIHSNLFGSYQGYLRCLEIQKAALRDGFIIDVYRGTSGKAFLMALTDDGSDETDEAIYSWDPDRDEFERVIWIVTSKENPMLMSQWEYEEYKGF